MLPVYSQFLLREAVRKPAYLLSPNVLGCKEIIYPRDSLIHILNTNDDNLFIEPTSHFTSQTPKGKRTPVMNITDLSSKEGTVMLLNKKLPFLEKQWKTDNLRVFRLVDFIETPNTDINLIGLVNYNTLKGMYKYTSSPVSNYYQMFNTLTTVLTTVKKLIEANKESHNFVSIHIPEAIPSLVQLKTMNKYNLSRYSRVVTDYNLFVIIELFKYLSMETRDKSVFNALDEQDTLSIVITFTYKEHCVNLPLNILVGMLEASGLESSLKLPQDKVQRLFLVFLNKVTMKVNKLLEGELSEVDELPESLLDDDIEVPVGSNIDIYKLTDSSNDKLEQNQDVLNKDINTSTPDITNLIETSLTELDSQEEVFDIRAEDKDVTDELSDSSEKPPIQVDYSQQNLVSITSRPTIEGKVESYIEELKSVNAISSADARALRKLVVERSTLPSPYNGSINIDVYKQVTKKDITLNSQETALELNNDLVPDHLKTSVIDTFDKKYIKSVLKKDIVSMVTGMESSSVIVKDYTIEETNTPLGNYQTHRVKFKPINGRESTVIFRIPSVDENGEFLISGNRVKLRKTRVDLPIRKISPTRVSLTSSYGKLFVFRSPRKADSPDIYIAETIKKLYLAGNPIIKEVVPGNRYKNTLQLPNEYTTMSMHFDRLTIGEYTLSFAYEENYAKIPDNLKEKLKDEGLVYCGNASDKTPVVMDTDSRLFLYRDGVLGKEIGSISDIVGIERDRVPTPFAMIKVLGDNVPLGVVLSYYIGLNNLIALTGSTFSVIESSKRYAPGRDEIVIKFADYKLIIKVTEQTRLLFAGFLYFKDFTKNYNLSYFSDKNIYLNMLETKNITIIHLKEMNVLKDLFVDPITAQILSDMGIANDFVGLLLKANSMLSDYAHPDVNDPNYSRIKGYERIAGFVYKALSESLREYSFKRSSKSKVELDPYKVWNYISDGGTVKMSEETNPITNTKESEAVTLTSLEGLSKDAVPTVLRKYHRNDMGLVSEATVDSKDVAINYYLSPYAKLKDIRGLTSTEDKDFQANKDKLLSTSALLTPFSEQDD